MYEICLRNDLNAQLWVRSPRSFEVHICAIMNSIYMLIFLICIHKAPAVDVVGIGLQSGKIILHNLKFDETVMSFHQEWGPVIGLTFRTGMRLVRPFSQLFLFPIAFPFVIAGDKWLTKWKIGTVIKRERKKEELKEGVWVYEKPTGKCWFSIFFSVPSLWHDVQATS